MSIDKNLKRIRDNRKLTQQEVADYVGVERKTYGNWESGVTTVKSEFIPKLAEFFKVEISELFKEKSSEIVITQNNSENKDHSINGIILILKDNEAVNELISVIRGKFGSSKI